MTPLERITKRVNGNGDLMDPATPRPLLTLAEFFEGNEDTDSFRGHFEGSPEPSLLHTIFKGIASQPNVADVRVEVANVEPPDWPFAYNLWIITSADTEEVDAWFEEWLMEPDECEIGWPIETKLEPCKVPPGMHPVRCSWD